MARGRARNLGSCGLVVLGAMSLLGCPGKNEQQLQEMTRTEQRVEDEAKPDDATFSSLPEGWVSYATGTEGWRMPSGGHFTGDHMTFGAGNAGAAKARWTYNTDSTGANGTALKTGVSFGAATGAFEIPTGPAVPESEPTPALPSPRYKP